MKKEEKTTHNNERKEPSKWKENWKSLYIKVAAKVAETKKKKKEDDWLQKEEQEGGIASERRPWMC